MTLSSAHNSGVLIVGAGPTGLVLALWLTRLGVRVRIVDKTAEPGTTSRALAVQARTLELYRQIGLADAVVERGRKVLAVNLWVAGTAGGARRLRRHGRGPQSVSLRADLSAGRARAAADRSAGRGRRRGRAPDGAAGASRTPPVACARTSEAGGWRRRRACEAAYVAGCDGAHSTRARGAGDRLSRRHVRASLLRRRRRSERRRDERRAARRARTRPTFSPSSR